MSLPTNHLQGNNSPSHYRSDSEQDDWDAPLLALTQKSQGDMRRLLYAFFSFLNRRTDFYMVPDEQDLQEGRAMKMGFRQGDAEKVLLAAFRQFPLRKIPRMAQTAMDELEPTSDSTGQSDSTATCSKDDASTVQSSTQGRDRAIVQYTEQGKQIPVGNGGRTTCYQWTQTLDEVTVLLPLPAETRAKELQVSIKTQDISIRIKDTNKALLEGTLSNKIKCDECTWTVEGQVLLLTLDKMVKTWWDCVLQNDEKIDTSLVDSKRKIADYDACTQGMIRKIMFDQQQQRVGKPTSDEILGRTVIPPLPPGVEYLDSSTWATGDVNASL